MEAVKATREQVEESRVQFYESKRLESMPFLQLELNCTEPASFESTFPLYHKEASNSSFEMLKFRNLGNGTAVNLIYTWECKAVNQTDSDCMPICAIQKEDSYCWQVNFDTDSDLPDYFSSSLVFEFDDLLGNTYEQKVLLKFSYEDGELILVKCYVGNPRYLGIVKYSLANKDGDERETI